MLGWLTGPSCCLSLMGMLRPLHVRPAQSARSHFSKAIGCREGILVQLYRWLHAAARGQQWHCKQRLWLDVPVQRCCRCPSCKWRPWCIDCAWIAFASGSYLSFLILLCVQLCGPQQASERSVPEQPFCSLKAIPTSARISCLLTGLVPSPFHTFAACAPPLLPFYPHVCELHWCYNEHGCGAAHVQSNLAPCRYAL